MNKLFVSLLFIGLFFAAAFGQQTSGPSSAWATTSSTVTTTGSHKSPAVHKSGDGGQGSANIDIEANAQLGDALGIHARAQANVGDAVKAKAKVDVKA